MPTIKFPSAAGGISVDVNMEDFSAVMERLAIHGLQQKVADSVANAKAKGWTKDECKERCEAVLDALRAGDWSGRSRVATFQDFILKVLADLAKTQDKKAKTADPNAELPTASYPERAMAAYQRGLGEPDSPLGKLIAAKAKEWEAMQAAPEADIEI